MKKVLLLMFVMFCCLNTWATTYYVSSSYTGSTSDGGINTPWKSIATVNSRMGTFVPGDFILFKKGDIFNGRLNITCLGNSTNRITFATYGSGAKPIFQQAGNECIHIGTSNTTLNGWIVVDGFNITDLTFDENDKVSNAPCEQGIRIGEYWDYLKTGIIIRNCDFSNIGGAVVINGHGNLVEYCTIKNMKNIKSTIGTDANGDGIIQQSEPGADDDYGANPFTMTGNDNVIQYNYISGGWAESQDYGWNGGAFEMFDGCARNKFIYNTIVDCGGIAEYGAFLPGATSTDNIYAYNKIINCGNLSWVNFNGPFTVNATNIQYYNNIIIENSNSRFSGINTGAGITTPRVLGLIYPEASLLSFSSNSPNATIYNLKNNIFYLQNNQKVVNSATIASKTTHDNNIYKLSGGATTNFTLLVTEMSTSAALFTSQVGVDPELWDMHPLSSSPAINYGSAISGFTFDWDGTAFSGNPDAGVYEFTLAPGVLSASSTMGTIACNGGSTTVTISATGGVTPYTGTGTFTRTAGTYSFTVTDALSNSSIVSVTVPQPAVITSTATGGTILINGGTSSITMSATAGGVSPYQYSLDGGSYQSGLVFNGVFAGAHTVTVRDANLCTITKSVTLTQPAVLSASNSFTPILCNAAQSTVTVSATGGVTPYTGTGTFLRSAGTYSFPITDANGATTNTSVTITQPTAIAATVSSGTIVIAGGTTTITVSPVSGGVSPYTYKLGSGSYQASNFFPSIPAGTYTVTIKDANGCLLTKTITITQPGALIASSSANSVLCNGGTTSVTVNAVGGVGPYSGTGTFTVTAGSYTYTVTDANSATSTTSITVSQPTALAGTATGGTILINGGSTTITMSGVSGGVAPYQYSLDGGSYQSGSVFSGVVAGSHTVTIKDANNCTLNKSVTLTQPTTLEAAASGTLILCNGGTSTVTVSATGGVTPYTGTGTFTVSAGTHNYIVTDANGATSNVSIIRTQPTAITGTLSSGTILINGGTTTLTVTASGGISPYTYKLDAGSYQSGTSFTGVPAGPHSVTIKDANNCTLVKTITITQPTTLVASSTATSILCNGGVSTITVSATGGQVPYTGTGNFVVSAGTYTYTVTDANGGTSTVIRTVTEPSALTGSLSSGSILISGGTTTITVTASGGTGSLTYSLNGGSFQSGNTFANTPAGSHSVVIKDANGCTITRTITITQPSSLVATAVAGTIPCSGSTTTVVVSATGGTTPYTGTGTFVRGIGAYSYTVTDAAGASSTISGTITAPTGLNVAVTAGVIQRSGDVTSITVNVTNGTSPYQYSLDGTTFQNSNIFTSISAGTYTITVRDANSCTKISTFQVTQAAVQTLKISLGSKVNVSCRGASNGSLTVTGQGGIGPYTYKKNNGSYQSSGTFSGLRSGTYKITVKDNRGKTAVTYVTIYSSFVSCGP